MGRNFPLVLVRQGLQLAVEGLIFIFICMVEAIPAVLRGVWAQSDQIARAYQSRSQRIRPDDRLAGITYWFVRIMSMVTILLVLQFVIEFVYAILKWILHI